MNNDTQKPKREHVYACAPMEDHPMYKEHRIYPTYIPPVGAAEVKCGRCGYRCWLGPMQQSHSKKARDEGHPVVVICMACLLKEISMVHQSEIVNLGGLGGALLNEKQDGVA